MVADRLQRVANSESDQDDCRPAMDRRQKVEKMRVRADHRGNRDHAKKQGREARWRGAGGQVAEDRDRQQQAIEQGLPRRGGAALGDGQPVRVGRAAMAVAQAQAPHNQGEDGQADRLVQLEEEELHQQIAQWYCDHDPRNGEAGGDEASGPPVQPALRGTPGFSHVRTPGRGCGRG